MTYNSAAIRKLLQNALSEEEFNMLCYDYFRQVYDQFSAGMSRLQKSQRLIEYCERQGQLDKLLDEVESLNPTQYQQFAASIGRASKQTAGQASSSAVAQPQSNTSLSTADLDHIRSLLDIKEKRLKHLEITYEKMRDYTPPHIVMEIETLRAEIKDAQVQLGQVIPPAATQVSSSTDTPQSSASTADSQGDKEIFVSYAWRGESEEVVDQLDKAFQDSGITIIRDKRDLGYRGRITEFMEKIGRGKAVIVVISKKYLESENCMFELVQIAKNNQFYDRIFPIVLDDANIYKPIQRLKYVKHWEDQIAELDEGMKSVNSANLQGFREAIDQYTEIRAMIADLTNILKDMNTLTVDMHREADFQQLIEAVRHKMGE